MILQVGDLMTRAPTSASPPVDHCSFGNSRRCGELERHSGRGPLGDGRYTVHGVYQISQGTDPKGKDHLPTSNHGIFQGAMLLNFGGYKLGKEVNMCAGLC